AAPASIAAVKPDVGPARRELVGLEWPLGVVADHERRPMAAKELVHLGHEPAFVAELEAVAALGQLLEGGLQTLVVPLEVGRELPQDRSHLRAVGQGLDRIEETLATSGHLAQALDVRHVATR